MYSDSNLKKCDAGEKDQCQIGCIKCGMREHIYLSKSHINCKKCQIGAYVFVTYLLYAYLCTILTSHSDEMFLNVHIFLTAV